MEEINNQPQSIWNEKLKGCVLAVEDNASDRVSVSKMLHSFKLYYHILNDNKQAVQAVTDTSSDLVDNPCDMLLIKHPMPEMDGFKAVSIIHKWRRQHALPKLPIIVLIEDAFVHDDKKECVARASTCLYRPFTKEDLYQALKNQLPILSCNVNDSSITARIGADVALLDQDALNEVRALQKEGNPDILLKIIVLYFTNSPKLAQSVEKAILAKDADRLRAAAHTLKSSSTILGAIDFSALCGRLEMMGKAGALEGDMGPVLNQFKYEYMAVRKALAAEYYKQIIQGNE